MPIIIASSNVFRRELSTFILGEAGYKVYEASDSATLLSLIEDINPSLVILDHWFGGLEASNLAQSIRRRTQVPILTLITRAVLAGDGTLLQGSPGEYLIWPYQSDELLSRVVALCRRPVIETIPSRFLAMPRSDISAPDLD